MLLGILGRLGHNRRLTRPRSSRILAIGSRRLLTCRLDETLLLREIRRHKKIPFPL